MTDKNIAIITARGGSKRIPKKNIRDFCGKPIIAYSITAAIESGIFEEVTVSTDSEEIAEIARAYGTSVPFMRSGETSGDYATTREVLLEVLKKYEELGKSYDTMACIYPTAPFITPEKLRKALTEMKTRGGCGLIPVVRFSFPPQRAYIIKDGALVYSQPEFADCRSQDLEPLYHDAGQFYFYDAKEYMRQNGVIEGRLLPFLLPETEVRDIDNEEDRLIAEQSYRAMLQRAENKKSGEEME